MHLHFKRCGTWDTAFLQESQLQVVKGCDVQNLNGKGHQVLSGNLEQPQAESCCGKYFFKDRVNVLIYKAVNKVFEWSAIVIISSVQGILSKTISHCIHALVLSIVQLSLWAGIHWFLHKEIRTQNELYLASVDCFARMYRDLWCMVH